MGFFSNLFGGKKEDAPVAPKAQPQEAPKADGGKPETKICTNCGAINTDGEVNCKDCASPL